VATASAPLNKNFRFTYPVAGLGSRPGARGVPHVPTGGVLVGPTPDRARARVNGFRKIHLYGKTKKSTHGHTNPKPFCTRFFQSLHARRAGSGEHNDTRQPFPRRPGRALRRVEVGALG